MPTYTAECYQAFRRLITRLKLEPPLAPVEPTLSTVIVPTASLDDVLSIGKVHSSTADLSGAAGTYIPYKTVPANKRFILKAARRAGTIGSSEVRVALQPGTPAYGVGDGGTAQVWIPLYGIVVNASGSIGMATTGNVADTAIQLNVFYREEDMSEAVS